jgi:uncharacterized protein (DUF1697 family)
MGVYAAFLRGINVSGNNVIKMEELKKLCSLPGFTNVATYIQSGNIIFETTETDSAALEQKLGKTLTKTLGYPTPVFLRSLDDMLGILKKDPFKELRGSEGIKEYVVFLSKAPDSKVKTALESASNEIDVFKFKGNELFIINYPDKGKSLLTGSSVLEKKIGMPVTARNWRTVNKMLELLKARRN